MAAEAGTHDRARNRYILWALARSFLIAVAIVVAFFVLPLDATDAMSGVVTLVGGLTAVVVVLGWHIRLILVAPFPAARAVSALVVTLPLFVVVFAAIYYLMAAADPSQWSEPLTRLDALYFTVTVFATVGFGDITAVSQTARALTTLQMVLGLTLVGVIARVVVGAVQVNLRRSGRS
ncbi:potassium channel family protein [Nocardioides sp. GXQ0305]|uniref:potassium channel family protein n=1 Tax=Nocardioides sp. GXQ0305 TaxID=3423912 RepID=UPI003D7D4B26